jgi:hypothetical protein
VAAVRPPEPNLLERALPLGDTDADCLVHLGRSLKNLRVNSGEQFCVFAFDCREHNALEPNDARRDELPFTSTDFYSQVSNWNAAFYNDVAPSHTEKAILDDFGNWISAYSSTYGNPRALYIYSFLIPCMRDGDHGHCADNVFAFALWAKEHYGIEKVCIGWSNSDRDPDMAHAISNLLADLDDEGFDISLHKVSIAG